MGKGGTARRELRLGSGADGIRHSSTLAASMLRPGSILAPSPLEAEPFCGCGERTFFAGDFPLPAALTALRAKALTASGWQEAGTTRVVTGTC